MKNFVLLFLLSMGAVLQAQAQDSSYTEPRGLYFQPFYSVDIVAYNNFKDESNFFFLFPQLTGFHTLGTDIGYYQGSRNYGLQFKYGFSISDYDLKMTR
ncbi:MAG TPA: hypothetical protein VE870_07885 [Bacteroidales bacterium]|nr:hypothetical protein [Bacteroidales bacterium]